MNKQEISEWIESAELVDYINKDEDDGCFQGCFQTRIYKKGDKYYSIDFYDFRPFERLQPHEKRGSGRYEVKEVARKTRIVEEVYYEELK